MISALGSILAVESEKTIGDEATKELMKRVKDPVGTFYMYGLASAIIKHRRGK
jgi:hypothetical protein